MSRPLCPIQGKLCYRTKGAAQRAAKYIERRHRGSSSAYLCPHCGAWHLTHYDYRTCHDFIRQPKNITKKDMKITIDTAFNDEIEITVQHTDEEEPQQLIGLIVQDRVAKRATALTYDQALELVEALKIQIAKL